MWLFLRLVIFSGLVRSGVVGVVHLAGWVCLVDLNVLRDVLRAVVLFRLLGMFLGHCVGGWGGPY